MRVMVRVAAWCAAKPCLHGVRAIAREPTSNRPSACVTDLARPTCNTSARSSNDVAPWWCTPCTSARVAVNATSVSVAAQTASSLAVPWAWAVTVQSATHPCCWSICSERRWSGLAEVFQSGARLGVDMPLCSRRAWITPSGLPTCPPPEATTTGAARCVSDTLIPQMKSRGWPNGRGDHLD